MGSRAFRFDGVGEDAGNNHAYTGLIEKITDGIIMDWKTFVHPGVDSKHHPAWIVLATRTYAIQQGKLVVADRAVPVIEGDQFADPVNPHTSEMIAESDIVPFKPFTDVIIHGKACAPRGKMALCLDCEAKIGPLNKVVRVYGERRVEKKSFAGLVLSGPDPFSEMPLTYLNAYGGHAKLKGRPAMPYFANSIGKGFTVKGGFDNYEELLVPNQEDPGSPITGDNLIIDKFEDWPQAPKPASFGWTRRNWYPRYTYAGILPEFMEMAVQQKEQKAPAMQKMDYRFFQGASEGLWGKQIMGNEPVTLKYFDPDQPIMQFQLPGERPIFSVNQGEGWKGLESVVQTVVIDMNEKTAKMVWRGWIEAAVANNMERLEVRVS